MPMTLRPGTVATRAETALVERDDRTRPHLHDLALDAEILEHGLEQAGVLLQRAFVDLGLGLHPRRQRQEVERRQLVLVVAEIELTLAGLGGALALRGGRLA